MVYATADIHGDIDRFHRLLEEIPIRDGDTLYIIGDVIDRGADGLAIFREIRKHENFVLLKGNHEQMCVETLGQENSIVARDLWLHNGGYGTYTELTRFCPRSERNDLIEYMANLPEQLEVTVNGRDFILVHAAPSDDQHTRLWARPTSVDWENVVPKGKTAIIGHTPTKYLRQRTPLDNIREPDMRIFFDERYICIDCGCGDEDPCSYLACLRLDDMASFYIPIKGSITYQKED